MKKILIVDDEKSFLLSLKDGLKKHSGRFQVFSAENGRQAVEILRSMSIDLLVTDLKMPEMNGFELLAWTSRHQPQLPVIVMSLLVRLKSKLVWIKWIRFSFLKNRLISTCWKRAFLTV